MSSIKQVASLVAAIFTVCLTSATTADAVHFEKLTCSSIPNTKQQNYNVQVTCSATVARPGSAKWYSAAGQNCPSFCASVGGTNVPSPDGFSCVSGEVRGWSAIGVVNFAPTGCWHDCGFPEGSPGSVSVGSRCYSPGQKRDNDRTDTTLGCFCATGDVGVTQIELGIYASGSASMSGVSSRLSGWESVARNLRNDKPGRMFDVLGVVPLGGTSTLDMVLNVQGACGTSVKMSGTIAYPNQTLIQSKDISIPLPSCVPQCSDGIDNDGDGAVDYPADAACSSANDNDENDFKTQCQDGIDNDGDGVLDYPADGGCSSTQDNDEVNPVVLKVIPIAECVDVNQNGTLVGHFGYRNDASVAVDVSIGEKNYFTPGAVDRGQPKTFFTGRVSNVFTVTFGASDTLKWVVGDANVSASIATERCQATNLGCIDTDNTKTLSALDGTARLQRRNIRMLGQKVLSIQSTGANATKAESYRELAQSLYLEQWAAIWGTFPKISKNCTACAAIDMSSSIISINTRSQRMNRLARQASTLLKEVRRGKLRGDEQSLVNDSSALYDSFVQHSQDLPRFESKCN